MRLTRLVLFSGAGVERLLEERALDRLQTLDDVVLVDRDEKRQIRQKRRVLTLHNSVCLRTAGRGELLLREGHSVGREVDVVAEQDAHPRVHEVQARGVDVLLHLAIRVAKEGVCGHQPRVLGDENQEPLVGEGDEGSADAEADTQPEVPQQRNDDDRPEGQAEDHRCGGVGDPPPSRVGHPHVGARLGPGVDQASDGIGEMRKVRHGRGHGSHSHS